MVGRMRRIQQPVQHVPDLRDQLLMQVQNLEVDQPTHDHMRDDEEPKYIQQQKQDLEQRLHGRLPSTDLRSTPTRRATRAQA
jgi:hypothetical protein